MFPKFILKSFLRSVFETASQIQLLFRRVKSEDSHKSWYHKSWDDLAFTFKALSSLKIHQGHQPNIFLSLDANICLLINKHYVCKHLKWLNLKRCLRKHQEITKVRLVFLIDFQRWWCFDSKCEMNALNQFLFLK